MVHDLGISGMQYSDIGTADTGMKTNNAGSYRKIKNITGLRHYSVLKL
jgi:hypothetical protein